MAETFKTTKLKLFDYEVMSTLETGIFGRVWLSKDKKSGEHLGLKMLKMQKSSDLNKQTILFPKIQFSRI